MPKKTTAHIQIAIFQHEVLFATHQTLDLHHIFFSSCADAFVPKPDHKTQTAVNDPP
jgi:hypothetical protein